MPDVYSTFLPVLLAAVAQTGGPVLELGAGYYSTPALTALLSRTHRFLTTFETDAAWLAEVRQVCPETEIHHYVHAPDLCAALEIGFGLDGPDHDHLDAKQYSVCLVDHRPPPREGVECPRGLDLALLWDLADVFVCHDTEPGLEVLYAWDRFALLGPQPKFTYEYRCPFGPWTTTLSKFPLQGWPFP